MYYNKSITTVLVFILIIIVILSLASITTQNRRDYTNHDKLIGEMVVSWIQADSEAQRVEIKRDMCEIAQQTESRDIPNNLQDIVGRCKED